MLAHNLKRRRYQMLAHVWDSQVAVLDYRSFEFVCMHTDLWRLAWMTCLIRFFQARGHNGLLANQNTGCAEVIFRMHSWCLAAGWMLPDLILNLLVHVDVNGVESRSCLTRLNLDRDGMWGLSFFPRRPTRW